MTKCAVAAFGYEHAAPDVCFYTYKLLCFDTPRMKRAFAVGKQMNKQIFVHIFWQDTFDWYRLERENKCW